MDNIKSRVSALWNSFLHLSRFKKLAVVVVLLVLIFIGAKQAVLKSASTPQYQTAQAEKGTLITSVTASGNVTNSGSADITTQSSGTVNQVYVSNGEYVTQGQTIATLILDQASQQKAAAAYASYLSAVNSLNSAKAKINSLQSALFKANQAFVNDKGSTPNPDTSDPNYIEENANWLQAQADYNNQQGVINQAEAALNSASLSLAQTSSTITAPISGYVSSLNLTPGLPITQSNSASSTNSTSTTTSSDNVGTISLPNTPVESSVNLTEIDVTKDKLGQKVTLTLDAFPNETFTGKVSAIDTNGSVSSGVTSYPTTITFDSAPKDVYPNMGVSATIITDVLDNVLLVPSAAVQTQNGQSYVQILKNGQASQVNVTTGESNDTQTEISSGLSEGDTVIIGTVSTQSSSSTTASPFGGTGGFGGAGALRTTGGGGNIRRAAQ